MRWLRPPSLLWLAALGERLLDLVDPEDDRGHHLGLLQRVAQAALRLADVRS
jgi:hypothetical protein